MDTPRVVWIGSEGLFPHGPSLLMAAGFRVETRTSPSAPGTGIPVDVIVLAVDPMPRAKLHWVPEGTRVVALCGGADEVASALAQGADDALPVSEAPRQLVARVTHWARVATADRDHRRRIRELESNLADAERRALELEALAHEDELTKLGNRRSMRSSLEYALEYAARYGGPLSLVMADLDGMKQLNDRYGHPAGDAALRTIAEVMRASLRLTDHPARLGGDEFAVVMPQTRAAEALMVAERIRDRIDSLILPGGGRLTASFGVASVPAGAGTTITALVDSADRALYLAKSQGKNRVIFADLTKVTKAA